MSGRKKYINGNPAKVQGSNSRNDSGYDLMLTDEDSALFEMISTYFKGLYDIEDVKSDPVYSKTREMVKLMISDYQNNVVHNKNNEKFIRDSIPGETSEAKIEKEINRIKQEISHSKLDDISVAWIKEWHEKRRRDGGKNKKTEEIREFITDSLKPAESMAEIDSGTVITKTGSGRARIIRYSSLAAAAIIGAALLIRSLLLSSNTDKIFSKNYEPFYAISDVTRSLDTGGDESFTSALESYKGGNYQFAATGFSEALRSEATSVSTRFFLGITQIALNDFNNAIDLLEGVANQQGEYTKEARWYLGLAYLKTGNKAKASECFELLAHSPGFYRERSEKILRRLE